MAKRPTGGPLRSVAFLPQLWNDLFSSTIHLDSAISKLPPSAKPVAARVLPVLLRRPMTTLLESDLREKGSPWKYNHRELWKPAVPLMEKLSSEIGRFEKRSGGRDDFPPLYIEEWEKDWGTEVADRLCLLLSQDPPLTLRASRAKGAPELLNRLKVEAEFPQGGADLTAVSPLGVSIAGYASVRKTTPFTEGWAEIQDEGSQVMSLFALWPEIYGSALSEKPGMASSSRLPEPPRGRSLGWTVIDACAGAGGKTLAMTDLLEGRGRMYAYDRSEKKLLALRRRAKAAGATNIQVHAVPQENTEEWLSRFSGTADRVLIDAPCSGWGVLKRNPDIKWRQTEEELLDLPELQGRLLKQYSKLAKVGGIVTFGVCTFRKRETVEVVDLFLRDHPEFEVVAQGFFGPGESDGFFMTALIRRKS